MPFSEGSSHANALTSATCAGGKTPRATRPRSLLKTLHALLAETSSPIRHGLAGDIEPLSDLLIRGAISRVQDRLRANHIPERARVRRGAALQLGALLPRQDHRVRALPRHRPQDSPSTSQPLQPSAEYLRRRPLRVHQGCIRIRACPWRTRNAPRKRCAKKGPASLWGARLGAPRAGVCHRERAPSCHAGGRGFESRRSRFTFCLLLRWFRLATLKPSSQATSAE